MADLFVIIAEQDWNLRNVLRQYLDEQGFRPLVTPIAGEAEDFARRVLARLVLLDVELPGISGYEACARIRHMRGYSGVPIVLMTGFSSTRRYQAAQRAGASAMLLKPFSMNDLGREMERFLVDPDLVPRRASDMSAPGFAAAPVKVWDSKVDLAWRFGEDSELSAGKRTLEMMRAGTSRD